MTRIAIIGAGLAGLTAARELRDCADVTVFEKSRGVGGRMATRYAPPYSFDHGAQFFTAKSDAFQAEVTKWLEQDIAATWNASFAEFEGDKIVATRDWDDSPHHYVGMPGMNAIGKHLADGSDVRINTEIAPLQRASDGWELTSVDGDELGRFDWVLSTAPAAQTAKLFANMALEVPSANQMLSCCALMLGFPKNNIPQLDWQAALVREADISWVSVNSSKPGHGEAFSVVVHSTNAYAEASVNEEHTAIERHLVNELRRVTGIDAAAAEHCVMHRWRYANTPKQDGPGTLLDPENRLAACGDWLIHGRIEAAYLSAIELAGRVRHME